MFVFKESIIGNCSVADCTQFLRGCVDCSLDEWLWCISVLHPEKDAGDLLF